MDWSQVLTIVGVNVSLFLWSRSESKADYRELRSEQTSMQSWMKDMMITIHEEIKDFHGRLCSLEERSRKDR